MDCGRSFRCAVRLPWPHAGQRRRAGYGRAKGASRSSVPESPAGSAGRAPPSPSRQAASRNASRAVTESLPKGLSNPFPPPNRQRQCPHTRQEGSDELHASAIRLRLLRAAAASGLAAAATTPAWCREPRYRDHLRHPGRAGLADHTRHRTQRRCVQLRDRAAGPSLRPDGRT